MAKRAPKEFDPGRRAAPEGVPQGGRDKTKPPLLSEPRKTSIPGGERPPKKAARR